MAYRTILLNYFHKRDRAWLLSLFAVVCLVYLPFLGNPFVFDDLVFFSGDVPDHYAHSLFQFDLRWFSYVSLGWTAAVFSDAVPHFFHLGNMLLHAANVILLFYLLRQLAGTVIGEQHESAAVIWGAWLGALVFACHPVAVYAVGYVIQRSILMATLFALVMQLAYVRGLLSGQKRWLLLAVAAYFLAVFSKEHSIMTLAVLAAMTILLRTKNKMGARALWLTWSALMTIALLALFRTKGVFGTPYEAMAAALFEKQGVVENTSMLHLLSVLTQAELYFKYLVLWVLPNPVWMSVDMREHFISSWGEWQGWAGALSFTLYGMVAFRLLLRSGWLGLIGLALLYPWLQFVVEFFSIRVQEPFVLYRSYLWMPGVMLFFPLLIAKLPGRRTLMMLVLSVLLLVPLAWNRLWVFADNFRLWNDAASLLHSERVPGADRIFYNRGQAKAVDHEWEEAIADFKRAVAVSPQLEPLRKTLGWAYLNVRLYQDANAQFDAAIAITPDDAHAYYGKGLALMGLHDSEQALQQMKRGCELGNKMACTMAAWSKK